MVSNDICTARYPLDLAEHCNLGRQKNQFNGHFSLEYKKILQIGKQKTVSCAKVPLYIVYFQNLLGFCDIVIQSKIV